MASQAGKRKAKLTERRSQLAELNKHRRDYSSSSSSSTASSFESSTTDGGDSNTPAAESQSNQSIMRNVIVIGSFDESDDSPPVTIEKILVTRVIINTVTKRTADKAFGHDELHNLLQSPPAKRRIHRVAAPEDIDSGIIVPSQSIGLYILVHWD
jgi:hypothetical protein